MSLLENYRLLVDDSDQYASNLYRDITGAEVDSATSLLAVSFLVRFQNNPKTISEKMSFDIPESQLTNVRLLVDHYLDEYATLHLVDDRDNTIYAAVVATEAVMVIEIIGRRVVRNDEDIRRSKFHTDLNRTVGSRGSSWLTGGKDDLRAVSDDQLTDEQHRDKYDYN